MADKIDVKLAHPLNPADLARLGLSPDTKANVNDKISVTKSQASSLIGAGYAQVDPDNRVEVMRVLEGDKAAEDVMPTATSGNTEIKNLTGDALDEALQKRGLPVEGKADEKRAAIAQHDATLVQGR